MLFPWRATWEMSAKSLLTLTGNPDSSTCNRLAFLSVSFSMNLSWGVMLVLLLLQDSQASTRFQTLSSATKHHGTT
jgi:hypothetical protein